LLFVFVSACRQYGQAAFVGEKQKKRLHSLLETWPSRIPRIFSPPATPPGDKLCGSHCQTHIGPVLWIRSQRRQLGYGWISHPWYSGGKVQLRWTPLASSIFLLLSISPSGSGDFRGYLAVRAIREQATPELWWWLTKSPSIAIANSIRRLEHRSIMISSEFIFITIIIFN